MVPPAAAPKAKDALPTADLKNLDIVEKGWVNEYIVVLKLPSDLNEKKEVSLYLCDLFYCCR